MRLAGRRIIVTGAASGIGFATTRRFLDEGAAVAMIDRDEDRLYEARGELANGTLQPLVAVACDVTDGSFVTRSVESIAGQLGGLDGVVNAAGVDHDAAFEDTTAEAWQRTLDVNLTGPFHVCAAATPHLREVTRSTIVHIASGAGLRPIPNRTAYCASKAGLVMFSKSLAIDLAPYGVRVNAICPGVVDTPMFRGPIDAGDDPDGALAAVLDRYLITDLASPGDIADAALFLSSDESSHVTGIALAVDGGRTFH